MPSLNTLHTARRVTSTIVFLGFLSAVVTPYLFPDGWVPFLAATQFIPSFLSFLGGNFAQVGFLLILASTLLFGRLYCSVLCPLGILQNIVLWCCRRLKFRPTFRRKPRRWLRYAVLAFSVGAFIAGLGEVVRWLDPFGIFGRLMSLFLFAPITSLWNEAVIVFVKSDAWIHMLPPNPAIPTSLLLLTAGAGLVIATMATFGRGWCAHVCPVGTILGLVARCSFFRLQVGSGCTACRRCENRCPTACLNAPAQELHWDSCVMCLDCVSLCKVSEIRLQRLSSLVETAPDPARRRMLWRSGALFGGLALVPVPMRLAGFLTGRALAAPTPPVIPPGAGLLSRFRERCTACQACVTHCPSRVIVPAMGEHGVFGFWLPHVNHKHGFCNFDCVVCGQVCPTGALQPLTVEAKRRTQIGMAVLTQRLCIVWDTGRHCGACAEHCPTGAIFLNRHGAPIIAPASCIGCGACAFICPTAAIAIEGHAVQRKIDVRAPMVKPGTSREGDEEDFPF